MLIYYLILWFKITGCQGLFSMDGGFLRLQLRTTVPVGLVGFYRVLSELLFIKASVLPVANLSRPQAQRKMI